MRGLYYTKDFTYLQEKPILMSQNYFSKNKSSNCLMPLYLLYLFALWCEKCCFYFISQIYDCRKSFL